MGTSKVVSWLKLNIIIIIIYTPTFVTKNYEYLYNISQWNY